MRRSGAPAVLPLVLFSTRRFGETNRAKEDRVVGNLVGGGTGGEDCGTYFKGVTARDEECGYRRIRQTLRSALTCLSLALLCAATAFAQPQRHWRQILDDRLRLYGHRNWIVVADSAYPLQSNPGIETILSNESQVDTIRHVLQTVSNAPHVRPVVYTDNELHFLPEDDAVGIGAYRQLVSGLFDKYLPDQKVQTIPHEEIIKKLDEASKTFNVLIVKTSMVLPYTSVFFELRAGYWSDDAERRLRESIK